MKISNQQDFAAGLIFLLLGAGYFVYSHDYSMGTAGKMGAGYFPRLLAGLLLVAGAAVVFRALKGQRQRHADLGGMAWKPLILLSLSTLSFGLALVGVSAWGVPPLGFLVACFLLIVLTYMAGAKSRLIEGFILALALSAGSYLVFIHLLELPIAVWPKF